MPKNRKWISTGIMLEKARLIFCGNMQLFGVKSESAEKLVEVR